MNNTKKAMSYKKGIPQVGQVKARRKGGMADPLAP